MSAFLKLVKRYFGNDVSTCERKLKEQFQIIKIREMAKKKEQKEQTTERKFLLNENSVFNFRGMSFSNVNLTDEIAMEFIAQNFNRAKVFKIKPHNYKKLIADHMAKIEAENEKKNLIDYARKSFGVKIDNSKSLDEVKAIITELESKENGEGAEK